MLWVEGNKKTNIKTSFLPLFPGSTSLQTLPVAELCRGSVATVSAQQFLSAPHS